ncbi:hypothetical protein XM38_038630 [Halomicronema hongdechloris C2206]|uniref:Pyridoxamine 5'-phosphate oxidase N-terminal domain-containing protein n=1 Tax=Halomicronema hongdechloris C2206 TaxID=1641165 RepID=A0A1Z3HRF9_9CYAN|nr:pyridoxamine 5'-phosphate oxidase family protein [Halomicronema hongdechloris]ASC72903.1 hypothetical protein XM38_038630 [Halomicronema hongdechloris C2206]
MGKVYSELSQGLIRWIDRQQMFFVATAPLAAEGHINCSPKGMDSFRVLGPQEVAYLDLTGSGSETIAHLQENGRIVVMFCAFQGAPQILRLYGTGHVYELGTTEFQQYTQHFKRLPGARAVIRVRLSRISDSCGYGVPLYDFQGQRETLSKWAQKKGETRLATYRQQKNRTSLDGLPGFGAS